MASGPAVRTVWDAPGANILGAPTRDGRLVTCADPMSGDLAVLDTATGKLRRLTEKGRAAAKEYASFSVPSRDGSAVAYAWFNDAGFYDLRVVPVSGGTPRVLFRNPEAGFVQPTAWTPDGRRILTLLFRKDNISQIAFVDAATGSVQVLRSLNWVYPKRMDLSPDGRWIVYDSFGGDKPGPRDIYALAADGSSERKVVESPGEDVFPVWSPDGTSIVFASDRTGTMDAWLLPLENGRASAEARVIARDLGDFLPMGATAGGALFHGVRLGGTDIVLAGANGTSTVLRTRTPGRNSAPAWSRDGRRIAYLSLRGAATFGVQTRAIVVHDVGTGVERDVPAALATVASVRWSPDGEWLLASGSDGKGRAGLFRVRVRDGLLRPEAIRENADYSGVPGDWDMDGGIVTDASAQALAVSRDGSRTARAYATRVVAGDREWPAEGVRWMDWQAGELLGSARGLPVALGADGVRKLSWKDYDGGPFSVHPDGRTVAYAVGRLRSEVRVMDNAFPVLLPARP
jgi:Tol biopolymer transport system component